MGFGPNELRAKAFVALEDAVQECRYRQPRRSFALRFALAYLWATSGADREPFEKFWRALGDPKSPWSFGIADSALVAIYRALGLERDHDLAMRMWQRHFRDEQSKK